MHDQPLRPKVLSDGVEQTVDCGGAVRDEAHVVDIGGAGGGGVRVRCGCQVDALGAILDDVLGPDRAHNGR